MKKPMFCFLENLIFREEKVVQGVFESAEIANFAIFSKLWPSKSCFGYKYVEYFKTFLAAAQNSVFELQLWQQFDTLTEEKAFSSPKVPVVLCHIFLGT